MISMAQQMHGTHFTRPWTPCITDNNTLTIPSIMIRSHHMRKACLACAVCDTLNVSLRRCYPSGTTGGDPADNRKPL